VNQIEIGLTQFIDFTVKRSSARVNFVKKVKYQGEYDPAIDYWRQLREEIKRIHENNIGLGKLKNLLPAIHAKKKENYEAAIEQYIRFFKGKQIEWFEPGRAYWVFDELVVRSGPDLGLFIDGTPYLLKLYFKGKTENVDKRNAEISLTLMKDSTNVNLSDGAIPAVLNVQKARFYPFESETDTDMKLALEADAQQLIYLWKKV
jgi:hypothetical protein